jgi:hypothetical protein
MTTTSTSRDLVLAVMHGGNFDYVAPFVISLKNSAFRGSTVLFTSGVDSDSLNKLKKCGVTVVPFRFSDQGARAPDRRRIARLWPLWRLLFSAGLPRGARYGLAHWVFHLRYRRYLLYSEFLERHTADFDRVFLADCRDIFFQADPFAWDWKSGVHFFFEETGHRMIECNAHRNWLSRQFGREFFEQHAQRTPACSGTTYGDMANIRQYLNLMVATTMRALNLGRMAGGDQGIHNYILINNLINNITVYENRRGPVMTMFWMRESDIPTDADGAVVNDDGSIVAVLHQYDRFPALKARLLSRL